MHMTLGERLKNARIQAGLTQGELAEAIGIRQQAIQKIENGDTKNPDINNIIAISKVVNKSIQYILLGINENILNAIGLPQAAWNDIDRAIKNNSELPIKKHVFNEKCFCLIVEDNSMENTTALTDTFPVGTLLIIDPEKKVEPGKYVIARKKESLESKAIFRKYTTDQIQELLIPLNINPAYGVYFFKDFDILGVVVASINLDL